MADIYDWIGITKIINACGTITRIGGSKMAAEVLAAMNEAAGAFVDIHKFHAKSGERIAELFGVEAACITSGASAGIAISAASCMTRGDAEKIIQLPETTGIPDEALMLKSHRILYDQALRVSGAKVREIGELSKVSIRQIEEAISDQTALFFYVAAAEQVEGSLPLADIIRVTRRNQIPVVVDAAAELPPINNVTKYLEQGADLVIISDGKEIRGPQSSGLILGRRDLIEACIANSSPNFSIGRSMKTDKETIAGIVKAVELFVKKDYVQEMRRWEARVSIIVESLSPIRGTHVRRGFPKEPGVQPADIPRVFLRPTGSSAQELQNRLMILEPVIYTNIQEDELVINPQCLEDDEVAHVIEAIIALLE